MKKSLNNLVTLTTFIASIFLASQALAKTEGNYISLDLSSSNSKNSYKYRDKTDNRYVDFSNSAKGFGLGYKYAFNFNNVFIAPELFYDYINNKSVDSSRDSVDINFRYGAKLNLGYDITDNLALYATAGYARNNYTVEFQHIGTQTANKANALYGFGLYFYPHKNIAVNFEYNVTHLTLSTPITDYNAENKLELIKLGMAFHF